MIIISSIRRFICLESEAIAVYVWRALDTVVGIGSPIQHCIIRFVVYEHLFGSAACIMPNSLLLEMIITQIYGS